MAEQYNEKLLYVVLTEAIQTFACFIQILQSTINRCGLTCINTLFFEIACRYERILQSSTGPLPMILVWISNFSLSYISSSECCVFMYDSNNDCFSAYLDVHICFLSRTQIRINTSTHLNNHFLVSFSGSIPGYTWSSPDFVAVKKSHHLLILSLCKST